jgi:hypothetical protein
LPNQLLGAPFLGELGKTDYGRVGIAGAISKIGAISLVYATPTRSVRHPDRDGAMSLFSMAWMAYEWILAKKR